MKHALALCAFTLSLALACTAQAADSTKRLGKFGDWESFSFGDGAAKTCYLAASATKVQGGEKGKTTTYLTVTHRAGGKGTDEVSINGPYGFKKESDVELQVGALKHSLFTKGDHAWAKDAASDKAIVASFKKAKEAQMHATPAKGAAISAAFPLAGFADALGAADKACGVKR